MNQTETSDFSDNLLILAACKLSDLCDQREKNGTPVTVNALLENMLESSFLRSVPITDLEKDLSVNLAVERLLRITPAQRCLLAGCDDSGALSHCHNELLFDAEKQ